MSRIFDDTILKEFLVFDRFMSDMFKLLWLIFVRKQIKRKFFSFIEFYIPNSCCISIHTLENK